MIQPVQQPTRLALGEVDPVQPLNLTHPLLRGVEGFWLPLPSTSGGSRLYDLSAYSRHGELADMDPATDWVYGEGSKSIGLDFTQSDNNKVEDLLVWDSTGAITIMLYQTAPIPPSNRASAFGGTDADGTLQGEFDRLQAHVPFGNGDMFWDYGDRSGGGRVSASYSRYAGKPTVLFFTSGGDEVAKQEIYANGDIVTQSSTSDFPDNAKSVGLGFLNGNKNYFHEGTVWAFVIWGRILSSVEVSALTNQARRGFPDLLRRRDESALYVSTGGGGGITGSLSLTDEQEPISATGQTEVSGTLALTDSPETVTLSGATRIAGTASVTDGMEQVGMSGTVITEGSLSVTDKGELISMVSTLQDIQGGMSITDSPEEISATGQVRVAGTMQLADGSEEVVILGNTDIQGTLSVLDLAEQIAATGAVELQGSLSLTDAGEQISARELVPERLATVDLTLEDIIIVNAHITD